MKNHTNKLPFGCGQCNLGFKLKIDLSKHCETAHNGIVVLQERNDIEGGEVAAATFTNEVNETKVEEIKLKQNEDQEETVIQYILGQFHKGPFKYYVIKEVGGWGGQMMMFDDKVGGWEWLNDDVIKK